MRDKAAAQPPNARGTNVPIQIKHRNQVAIVQPMSEPVAGRQGISDDLVEELIPLLEDGGARLVLDLRGVDYLNSQGMGNLVRIVSQANQEGGRVVLTHLAPFVVRLLETTKLDRFFLTTETIDEAIALAERADD